MKKLLLFLALAAAGLQGWADEPTDYLAIVGGATKAGWPGSPNADNRSVGQMVNTGEHTWVWVGKLTAADGDAGNFKFAWTVSGWDGYWSDSSDAEGRKVGINDVEEFNLSTDNPSNRDWKFHVESTGIYRVVVHSDTKKMNIEKLSAPSEVEGYYQIATEDQFMWYAGYATSDGATAKARLTANLNFANKNYFPLGCETYKFAGELDGNGHSITLGINSTSNYQGVIGHATDGAKFKNLIITGSVKGGSNTAALVGEARGDHGTITISCVGCEANVTSTSGICGAFVGNNWGGTVKMEVENCYNSGNLSGTGNTTVMGWWTKEGSTFKNVYNSGSLSSGGKFVGFCDRGSGTLTNCYTISSESAISGLTTSYSLLKISTGELCYNLNGNTQGGTVWRQTLSGVDAHPVFLSDHKKVYQYNTSKYVNDGDKVEIGDVTDLANFAALVNYGVTSLNADLTADIDTYSGAYIGETETCKYNGTFDGKTHKITIYYNKSNEDQIGLFKNVDACTIQNLIVDGDITGSRFMAGLVNRCHGNSTIQNIVVGVNMTSAYPGDGTHGGVISVAQSGAVPIMKNVAFVGSIEAPNSNGSSGIIGYAHTGGSITYTNCYVTGTLNFASNDNNRVFARNGGTCTNCYTTNTTITKINDSANKFNGSEVDPEDVTSGKLCYLLNGTSGVTNWYQDLTIDNYPYPFDTHSTVYRRGTDPSYTYSNITTGSTTAKIKSAKDLNDFSALVNAGNTTLSAELTTDIDMTGESYTPIGTISNKYHGDFNGNGKTITLAIDNSQSNQGLIGVATGGTNIHDLIVDGSVTAVSKVGGIIGFATNSTNSDAGDAGGTITLTNVINKANVHSTGNTDANAAGFVGCAVYNTIIEATNCGNTGNVSGQDKECAAFMGWTQDNGKTGNNLKKTKFTNCWNSGTISNMEYSNDLLGNCNLYRNTGKVEASGCYDASSTTNPKQGTLLEVPAVASGELCYKVNNGGSNWYQTLGTDNYPVPFSSSESVLAGKWFNDDDYDVFYNKEGDDYTVYQLDMSDTNTKYGVPENANVTAKNVSVSRNMTANQWIGLCLPFDYDIPSGWDVRELTSVVGSGESASMKFSAANAITTIEAGKPYIVKPSSAVTDPITATNKAIATAASTIEEGDVNMIGNFAQIAITNGSYYINTSSQLKKLSAASGSANLKGFRAYFTVDVPIKALNFDFDDDATGIEAIDNGQLTIDNEIYNLAGQRINKVQKGVNIVNGKKILK